MRPSQSVVDVDVGRRRNSDGSWEIWHMAFWELASIIVSLV